MPEYTATKTGATFQINSGDKHIANYDPVEENLEFTDNKFKNQTNKVKKFIADGGLEINDDASADNTSISDLQEENKVLGSQIENLEEQISDLQEENENLKEKLSSARNASAAAAAAPEVGENFPVAGSPKKSNDARYADDFDDSEAPAQDPRMGDLTPSYVAWARKNMPSEVFKRRYNRRLK